MKTKVIALLLTLLMIFGLVACQKDAEKAPTATDEPKADTPQEEEVKTEEAQEETSDNDASIKVAAESSWLPHYEAAAERVKAKYPNATIELVEIGAFDHLDTIDQTDATNPDVADVFALPADRLVNLYEKEVLAALPATEMAETLGGFSDFEAGLGGNFKLNGEYMAFPYNIETLISFVNTANAEANGFTTEQVFEVNDMDSPHTVLIPVFNAWFGVAATNAGGIELLGKDDNGQLFSDLTKDFAELAPEKQEVLETLFNYWKKHFAEGTALFDPEAGFGYIDNQFASGEAGVIRLGGPWDTANLSAQANDGKDLEILPIGHISVSGRPLTHWKGGWGLAANSRIEEDPAKMELAISMIQEIVNPEYFEDLFKATGKVLENVPAEKYAASSLEEVDKKVVAATLESYKDAPARPLFKEWGQVWDTWQNAILSWNAVQPKDVEEAYAELKAAFDAMMENFN